MEATDSPVSRADIEQLWSSLAARTADPYAGIFGPASVTWKVNRESALFLGAGRASLLQLAHPWVAAALDQHSNLRTDPLARFHNTFRVVFTMIFGTLEQALAASRQLYDLHTRIQGRLPQAAAAYPQGSHYQANELNALRWVHATLVESALIAYDAVLPPLSTGERERYYRESKIIASLFGIPAAALPGDWSGFEAYTHSMWASPALGVNSPSLEMAHRVLHGRGSWIPIPSWYRALTAAWMPERLREDFSLSYGGRERAAERRAQRLLPQIYRKLPRAIRFVGPYWEAKARLEGRPVNLAIKASNRFWIGQLRMMFPPSDRKKNEP